MPTQNVDGDGKRGSGMNAMPAEGRLDQGGVSTLGVLLSLRGDPTACTERDRGGEVLEGDGSCKERKKHIIGEEDEVTSQLYRGKTEAGENQFGPARLGTRKQSTDRRKGLRREGGGSGGVHTQKRLLIQGEGSNELNW